VPPAEYDPKDVLQPGETIIGTRAGGLDDLTAKGGKMMDTLNEEVLRKINMELDEIQIATRSINAKLLSDENLKNLQETFANLKTTTSGFAQTSKDLDAVVAKTGEAVEAAKGTLKTVDGAAADVRLAIAEVRKMTDSANVLVKKATTGEGTLGTLISDKQAAENLKALIINLRRSGVLFYKDRPLNSPEVSTPPPRSRGR
jgi:ABC-type transporter Mla subunit MlaD